MNFPDDQLEFPAQPPDEDTLQHVEFNVTWVPVLIGVVERLKEFELFASPPSDYIAQIDELIGRLQIDVPPLVQQYSSNALHFHVNSKIVNGNNVAWVAQANAPFGGIWLQQPPAILNAFQFNLDRDAGGAILHFLVTTTATSGIMTVEIDGNALGTIDLYSASTVVNVEKVMACGTLAAQIHTVLVRMLTKNALSTNYACELVAAWLT